MEDKYYIELKEKALKVEIYDRARDYAKDKNKVNAYFENKRFLFMCITDSQTKILII
ncbi:MAG: hypothetical protein IKF91_01700 [Bacilli bacterium]|nr:hypothetical protein [Bacilli bacterium]